jgi:uncharacterized membrane protein YraQ (UPF0718 family)
MNFLSTSWSVLAEMAPYLWVGFLAAGVISAWMPVGVVERHLGRRGLPQVVKATLFGIPLPLCSCGVIPVAASLRRQGASRGATISFLTSTPQTGVDSILVTWSLLGPVFTLYRVAAAFLSGLICGSAVDAWADGEKEATEPKAPANCCGEESIEPSRWRHSIQYGFQTLPAEIGMALIVGILISAVITTLIPAQFAGEALGGPMTQILAAMVAGIPFYVCSTGSVPIAMGLVAAGLSPGAAMAFLITGPATNAATLTTVWSVMGRRTAMVYLSSILGCAWVAGLLAHRWVPAEAIRLHAGEHAMHLSGFDHAAAAGLLLLLVVAIIRNRYASHTRGGEENPSCRTG